MNWKQTRRLQNCAQTFLEAGIPFEFAVLMVAQAMKRARIRVNQANLDRAFSRILD